MGFCIKRWGQMLAIGMVGSIIGACSWFSDPEVIRSSALRNFEQGNAAYNRMDYQNAIINYRKAIELDNMTPEFHYNLGLAFHSIDSYEEALQSYKIAAELNPKMAEVYYNAALIHHKLYNADKAHQNFKKYQKLVSVQRNAMIGKNSNKNNTAPIKKPSVEDLSKTDPSAKNLSKKEKLTKSDSKKMPKIVSQLGQ